MALLPSCSPSSSADDDLPSPDRIANVARAFIEAGLAGDEEGVRALCLPDRSLEDQAANDLPQMQGLDTFAIIQVHADDDDALAVSNALPGQHEGTGQLVFHLLRQPNDEWLIDRIDFGDADEVAGHVERFSTAHSSARMLRDTR